LFNFFTSEEKFYTDVFKYVLKEHNLTPEDTNILVVGYLKEIPLSIETKVNITVSNLLAPLANAEAEAEAEADKTKICPPKPDGSTDFGIFWAMYPRKEGKGNARMAFKKKKCSAIMAKIELAVERQKKSDQWQKDSGQFIPMPATWINQERWDDEGTAVPVIHKPRSDPKAAIRDRAIAEIMERLKPSALPHRKNHSWKSPRAWH